MILLTLPDGKVHEIRHHDCTDVYRLVAGYLCGDIAHISKEDHLAAAEAEGWAELACVGERYEDPDLPGLSIDIKPE